MALTLQESDGRGIDWQVRQPNGRGFRLAISLDSLAWINKLLEPVWLSRLNLGVRHSLRLAVELDSVVHLFLDSHYLSSHPLAPICDLDETGMADLPFIKGVEPEHPDNLIDHPLFADAANNTAPLGWLSEKPMGGGTSPRVQVNNAEWPNQSVFTFRFDDDTNYGTWFAYPIKLEADSWYEFAWTTSIGAVIQAPTKWWPPPHLTATGNKPGRR